jgi:hypothetical protein
MSTSERNRGYRCYVAGAVGVVVGVLGTVSAHAQGMGVKSLAGAVTYQHPGIPGNPTTLEWALVSLLNKPKVLDPSIALSDGDGVRGDGQDAALQLVCADGATQTLSGSFDAIVNVGSDGRQCAITLRAGSVLATTAPNPGDENTIPTRIVAGDVTLGASSTQFGASIVEGAGTKTPRAEAFVMDGTIQVQRLAAEEPTSLSSGQRLPVGKKEAAPIEEATYQRFASAYANLEVMSLPVEQRSQAQGEFRAAYLGALKRPRDAEAQRQLEQIYQSRGVKSSPVLIYRQSHFSNIEHMNVVPAASPAAAGAAARAASEVAVPATAPPP